MANSSTVTGEPIALQRTAPPADSVPLTVTRITLSESADWDAYNSLCPDGTFFHTLAWRHAVQKAFGHEDIYLSAVRGDRIVGVLPMFFINSRIGGRMLVSVPYGVGGGIIADDDEVAVALFDAARGAAVERKCATIDLRSEKARLPGIPIVDRYVVFRKSLPSQPEDVLGWLPRKARAAARNARNKYRLEVAFGDQHLHEVWRLYTISMRRLASLAYPFSFFESLIEHTPDAHSVSLVRRDGRAVAGLVTFYFRDAVIPYFIGSTGEAKSCSAANLIYLAAMELGVAAGYRVFDFGRSRRDNAGSFDFKRFNGFAPRPLQYQTYLAPGAKASNLSPSNPRFRWARAVWRHLPLGVTRALGARLARDIPG